MKIVGIESSSLVASVAVLEDETLIAEYTVNYKKTHSQTLLPMLDEILTMTEQELSGVDGIAVSEGPGSFTGLRIGSATAKGLGLALGKPLLAVPTVDAMAYQLFGCAHLICPIMDAKRQQVYTGLYTFEEEFRVLKPARAVALSELLTELAAQEKKVVFLGDGVPVSQDEIRRTLGEQALFAPAPCSRQRAAAVAALGLTYLRAGRVQTAAEHAPNYIRISQAERELARKRAAAAREAGHE
ncbi:MAG: tRNA (adenosine(37)-N6)-threonylcarbamoyltransferase complex dimerization subunit type 1 TsaB [Lachnospiraceae bacterium]|nr:tRNA (adenosine(37)-N6)-threonylcarbamoyltransferase complex dimerization subunit type 1 TsaB [Lachnospiraceae bacterium]